MATIPGSRFALGYLILVLLAVGVHSEECYCDRWFSTNTRTLDFTPTVSDVSAGMSYRGAKDTTFNGIECLTWEEVFDRCTDGFESENRLALANDVGDDVDAWIFSTYLSHMLPDRLGIRENLSPEASIDDFQVSRGECRMPSLREAWYKSAIRAENSWDDEFMPAELVKSGPFCFVDATDPRALNFTRANGWNWGILDPQGTARAVCPGVTPVPCGVPRCSPDVVDNESTQCARGAAVDSSSTRARLLLANGKFELWARRTNRNGIVREVSLSRDPPNSWAAVTYKKYPPLVEGANPAEPRFWDLCLYSANDVEALNIGYNASTDGVEMGHLLHKFGALVRCDAVVPRVEGISLSEHSPGRGGSASAARMEFVKANDTAALKAENGAVAALAPNVVHVAKAWVRCVRGAATVALVVSSLPVTARADAIENAVSMKHYDAMTNISLGSGGTRNVMRCEVDPSAYTSSSDAPESVSAWTQLEVAVSSARGEHEVTVQLVVQSHSDDAAVLMDDVSLEAETNAMPRRGTAADGSSATSVFSGTCSGGGGAGVSFTESHKCATDPTYLFYHIREKGGVPVVHEQVHAMVRIGYRSVKCRMPELDATSRDECPFLSEAALPHLSADDVRAYMDTLTDEELTAEMGWDDAEARGPEVMEIPGVALEILRAGLPEAIETGVVRVVDGPEYNVPAQPSDNPNIGASPTAAIIWHTMSSSTDLKVFDGEMGTWRLCGHHEPYRKALCYFWAEVQHAKGCGMVASLLAIDGWEEYVGLEGFFGTIAVMNSHYLTFLEPIVGHFADLEVEGKVLCYSSITELYDVLRRPPPSISGSELTAAEADCANPLSRAETMTMLSVILPTSTLAGKECIDLTALDYDNVALFDHHAHFLEKEDAPQDEILPAWAIGIICAAGAVAACAFFIVLSRRRSAQEEGKDVIFSQVEKLPQGVLSKCKHREILLGKGSEAEVYLADVTIAGRTQTVASKMYFRSSTAKSELHFYEGLPRDDNILQVYGCYMDPETKRWCLAMEYCRHGNIRQSMAGKTFPRNGGFLHHGVTGVMRALATLHGNKMAHRDLKLDNVLLHCPCLAETECGCLRVNSRSVVPKLADFGMSRQGTLMQMSSANMKGTLMYIPPERVQYNLEKHDENFYELADIYALGLMIWEGLYYVRHGEAVSCAQAIMSECHEGQDVLIRISSGTFVPPCDFLPEPIRRFLRKCWHVKPSRRYQNMTVVLNEWENLRKLANSLTAVDPELHSQTSSTGGSSVALLDHGRSLTGSRSLATSVTTEGSTDTRST